MCLCLCVCKLAYRCKCMENAAEFSLIESLYSNVNYRQMQPCWIFCKIKSINQRHSARVDHSFILLMFGHFFSFSFLSFSNLKCTSIRLQFLLLVTGQRKTTDNKHSFNYILIQVLYVPSIFFLFVARKLIKSQHQKRCARNYNESTHFQWFCA